MHIEIGYLSVAVRTNMVVRGTCGLKIYCVFDQSNLVHTTAPCGVCVCPVRVLNHTRVIPSARLFIHMCHRPTNFPHIGSPRTFK